VTPSEAYGPVCSAQAAAVQVPSEISGTRSPYQAFLFRANISPRVALRVALPGHALAAVNRLPAKQGGGKKKENKMVEHHNGTESHVTRAEGEGVHDEDFVARVAWALITEPGDVTRGALIAAHGAAEALRLLLEGDDIAALRERVGGRCSRDAVSEAIARTEAQGFQIVTPAREHWPTGLADLGDAAPVCLWVRGNTALLSTRSAAIFGARAATRYGENVTMTLTQGLVDMGWTIVSGRRVRDRWDGAPRRSRQPG
jgi:hypothetical protein